MLNSLGVDKQPDLYAPKNLQPKQPFAADDGSLINFNGDLKKHLLEISAAEWAHNKHHGKASWG